MSFLDPVLSCGSVVAPGNVRLHVLVILPAGHSVFSLSILLDLLAAANHITGQPHFTTQTVAARDAAAAMMQQDRLPPDQSLVLIADADGPEALPDLAADLTRLWRRGGRVGAWGAGCLALAQAGLLEGRRFAMAAADRPALADGWPALRPTDGSYCDDDRVLTSVGQSVLSDMVLHLIRDRCGHQVMAGVMDHCLIRRTPDEGPLLRPPAPTSPAAMDPRITALDRWIETNMARRFKAHDLAPNVGLSTRQLERLFLRHLDRTPADHLEHKRMTHALKLMRDTGLSLDDIARSTGHPCTATFRRKFKRKFGMSPTRS